MQINLFFRNFVKFLSKNTFFNVILSLLRCISSNYLWKLHNPKFLQFIISEIFNNFESFLLIFYSNYPRTCQPFFSIQKTTYLDETINQRIKSPAIDVCITASISHWLLSVIHSLQYCAITALFGKIRIPRDS